MGPANIFFIIIAVVFAFFVIRSTIKQKMIERDSIIWLLLSLVAITLGIWPSILDAFANLIGIEYGPSLLFLISILALFYLVLKQSLMISQMSAKIRELAQRLAIAEGEIFKNADTRKPDEK